MNFQEMECTTLPLVSYKFTVYERKNLDGFEHMKLQTKNNDDQLS